MAGYKGKNPIVKPRTFRGFSSRAEENNFHLYDFQLVKQDLMNRLSIRKGERVENPEFGTIIYDVLFEPLTETLKQAIVDDITQNLSVDPRISTQQVVVTQADHGISVEATISYTPYNITEKLLLNFSENRSISLS